MRLQSTFISSMMNLLEKQIINRRVKDMDELKKNVEAIAEDKLQDVSGGVTRDYLAALDVMNGKYGNGDDRIRRLTAACYDYNTVQNLVNGLAAGYDKVARDVINGKYGNGADRIKALKKAGFDAQLVQDIVNGMLLK